MIDDNNSNKKDNGFIHPNKKSGFQLSIEGKQEFPPKVVEIRKIDVVFDAGTEQAVVVESLLQ